MSAVRITLKRPVWALEEPTPGLHYRFSGERPRLSPGLFGTLFPSRELAIEVASVRLAGIPHALVRLEA